MNLKINNSNDSGEEENQEIGTVDQQESDSSFNTNNGYNSNSNYNQSELFTWRVKAGANRMYYINVKKDRNDHLYLVIKENKRDGEGNKDVHRIMIFEKDLQRFVYGLKEALQFINNQGLTVNPQYDDFEPDNGQSIES